MTRLSAAAGSFSRVTTAAEGPDTPELRKARGAFFTPAQLARYAVDWAVRDAGDAVLEPSCGEAAFLTAAAERLTALGNPAATLHGVEVHAASAREARRLVRAAGHTARVEVADFFTLPPRPGVRRRGRQPAVRPLPGLLRRGPGPRPRGGAAGRRQPHPARVVLGGVHRARRPLPATRRPARAGAARRAAQRELRRRGPQLPDAPVRPGAARAVHRAGLPGRARGGRAAARRGRGRHRPVRAAAGAGRRGARRRGRVVRRLHLAAAGGRRQVDLRPRPRPGARRLHARARRAGRRHAPRLGRDHARRGHRQQRVLRAVARARRGRRPAARGRPAADLAPGQPPPAPAAAHRARPPGARRAGPRRRGCSARTATTRRRRRAPTSPRASGSACRRRTSAGSARRGGGCRWCRRPTCC